MVSLCAVSQIVMAQAPKWVEKAKKAVFSVITYGEDDKLLNTGNGFFVSENGVALSDYSLFKGAKKAVIVNSEGKQMPVESIMGADDMYDVVRFKVAISGKKVPALVLVGEASSPVVGAPVYLLPYSTRKDRSVISGKVEAVDKVSGNYKYYTLGLQLKDKMVSCPVVNEEGMVMGIAQKSSGRDTATICYAVDVALAMDQHVTALSYADQTLRSIGIKKALPDTEEQALVFLFMASSQLSPERYAVVLDDFIEQYPESSDGYYRRAINRLALAKTKDDMKLVEEDMKRLKDVSEKEDEGYYNCARLIYDYTINHSDIGYEDWSFDKALENIQKALEINPLPVYMQFEGDIYYAQKDYAKALACYEEVNKSELASPATFLNAARTKEVMQAPVEEVVSLMDSCMARFTKPYTLEAAPYLLERARILMVAGKSRQALIDYDDYYKVANGEVNDVFYYWREQAALESKQYQRALDDIAKAIELNPEEVMYKSEQAMVNLRVGRNEEALNILNGVIAGKPDYAEAYRLQGLTYLQMKKKEDACRSFAKAKELGDTLVDDLIEKYCK